MPPKHNKKRGVTLIETLIGIVVIAIVGASLVRTFTTLLDVFSAIKIKNAATNLASEQMEVVKNVSYQNIGTVGGIPPGIVAPTATFSRDGFNFLVTTSIRNIDDPFDGTIGGNPNDTAPADYKLVEISVSCVTCVASSTVTITGRAAPKNLENASTNGALFVQAINANGQFISGATVQVVNNKVSPSINITDTTNTNGILQLVHVPPSFESYAITVSKAGYSTERTYATSSQNPNPVKPNATVAAQTVTQLTFAIDQISNINYSSLNTTCSVVEGTSVQLSGAKLIGTNPDILKFSQNYVFPIGGAISATGLEWDNYSESVTNSGFELAGTIPIFPLSLTPAVTANVKLIMQPKNSPSILVTVLDSISKLPLSNATVTINQGGFSATLGTGRGFLRQTDWSGGAGQEMFQNQNQFSLQDGNVDVISPAGDAKLLIVATSTYASAGWLISSIFDTGSPR